MVVYGVVVELILLKFIIQGIRSTTTPYTIIKTSGKLTQEDRRQIKYIKKQQERAELPRKISTYIYQQVITT
jgi:hypothetical protein